MHTMYQTNPEAKFLGALLLGVPGVLAGLHVAWLKHIIGPEAYYGSPDAAKGNLGLHRVIGALKHMFMFIIRALDSK
jgi:hypothetical protein